MNPKFIAMLSEKKYETDQDPHCIIRGEGKGIECYNGKAFVKAWPKGKDAMIYGNKASANKVMKELNDKGAKLVPANYFCHEC